MELKVENISRWGAALLALAVAACGDDPTGPSANAPASLAVSAGSLQSAPAGQALTLSPKVVVKNASGAAIEGVTVTFAIVSGGGDVDNGTAETNALGEASAGTWRLGSNPGVNVLEARVAGVAAARFTATGTAPFQITVRYIGNATESQKLAVDNAVVRWTSAIVGDLSDVPLQSAAADCFPTQPDVDETIDDVLIFIEFVDIDGVGKTLGQAGPCYIRSENSLPIMGRLQLDNADLLSLEGRGLLDDVVLHEIGHVLGIGTLWKANGLVAGVGGGDPQFTGPFAIAAYQTLTAGAISIPVENTGGSGTRDSHWRETTFGNELMTGFLNTYPNPLSGMTIGSLRDIGYGVNSSAAQSFVLAAPSTGSAVVDFTDSEIVELPKYMVDRHGLRYELRRR
jgi:hypothetical protein